MRRHASVQKCNTFFIDPSSIMKKQIQENLLLYRVRVKNDTSAFSEIYDTYVVSIYRFVYLKVSHKQDAEDITSDVFLKAWAYLTNTKNKEISSLRGLLYTIARNKVIDFYRDRAKKQEKEQDLDIHIATDSDVVKKLQMTQEVEQILSLVKSLKQEYQEVVLLKYIEEYSTADIAKITGKSKASVRVTLHRAMKKLKEAADSDYT